ncbi:DUF3298 and DUF4163 domain-containing protein [Pedobacter arcticus]|uniref:DUF3298 and DUF4163 domain-containing protein n=1 Tax=Pedobacter arcticus TaxID=752140 RepID=UPI00031F161F|nr:DUF3298 and DUF4163 domain-containing protein [Pedobacter arcticus]
MRIIVIALCCLTIVACQNKKATNTEATNQSTTETDTVNKPIFKDSLKYSIVHFYKTTEKSRNPKDSSDYAYVKAVYPKFGDSQKYLSNKVLSIVTAEPWTGNKTYSLDKASQSFFKDYLDFKKDYPDAPGGYTWDENLKVSFQDVNLVVFTAETYVYTGGAHGIGSTVYHNIDLKNQKELTLKDLLVADYNKKLTAVAASIFRKDEGITADEPLDQYFFENKVFKLNDNFAITAKGLLFTYNVYEIKPYSDGTTDLLIPYVAIKDLIKSNSFISKYVNK